ncbi:MAG: SufD family Fe-S cluster assembly protein, partial [Desulfobacteraceae bacterium]
MHDRDELRQRAEKARDKKAALGPDVDLSQFDPAPVPHDYMADEDLCTLPMADQQRLLMAGMDVNKKERSGTFFQKDTQVVHCQAVQEGVEVIPIRKALEEEDWIGDYYWELARVDADKYTAAAVLDLHDGYVIRALPGSKSVYPIQACMYLDKEGLQQNVHNIIIAEEDSELHIITGCATSPHMRRGLHVGISEFFIKKGAKLSFTMIHNWAEDMSVRPRSAARVEEGGVFLNNYICMKPVQSLQMYPTTYLTGKDAVARFNTIVVGSPGSEYDMGGRIVLEETGGRAEIISRVISNGGRVTARGHLVGRQPGIKA